jgi:hypothetical protein
MRRSLIAMALALLCGFIGATQQRSPVVKAVIQAAPERIRKAALVMSVPHAYLARASA